MFSEVESARDYKLYSINLVK